MKTLRTINSVTHADVAKVLTGGTKDGIVTMNLNRFAYTSDNGIEVAFEYIDDQGNVLPTVYNGGPFKVASDAVKTTSQVVNGSLPSDDNIEDRIWNEIIAFAKLQMASSFSILASEIEEVI